VRAPAARRRARRGARGVVAGSSTGAER
jgi:hypothetical protein